MWSVDPIASCNLKFGSKSRSAGHSTIEMPVDVWAASHHSAGRRNGSRLADLDPFRYLLQEDQQTPHWERKVRLPQEGLELGSELVLGRKLEHGSTGRLPTQVDGVPGSEMGRRVGEKSERTEEEDRQGLLVLTAGDYDSEMRGC